MAKDTTKEDHQGKTESLSSDVPPAKDNSDEEDFQPGTSSSNNDEDDDMESDKNIPRGHKRKNKG